MERWRWSMFHRIVPRERRGLAIVGVGLGLVALVVFLLGSNYVSQLKLRDAALEQVKLDAERSAETLGFFFASTRKELETLADAQEVFAYFANEALGISLRYGLQANLLELSRLLTRTMWRRGPNGELGRLYAWVAFVDRGTGQPLATSEGAFVQSPNGKLKLPRPPSLLAHQATLWTPSGHDPAPLYAALPYFFKGKDRGYLLAQLEPETVRRHLLEINATFKGRQTCLVFENRCLRLTTPRSSTLDSDIDIALPAAATEKPVLMNAAVDMIPSDGMHAPSTPVPAAAGHSTPMYAMLVPIPETPFVLATFTPVGRVAGQADPARLLALTGLLALVVLAGTFVLWRLDNHNLILQTRFEEDSRKKEALAELNVRLYRLAHHDTLTQLANRTLLKDRLEHALLRARRDGEHVAVLFADLDRFKTINDTLGHPVGDAALQAVGQRILNSVREVDTVARQGGDEFIILLEGILEPDDVAAIAYKILKALATPLQIAGHELFVTASIGGGIYPDDGDSATELIRNADTAMYRAKELGRNSYQRYAPNLTARVVERFALERDLRGAAERDEFSLHYQPQVALADGRLVGAEALLRWRHPRNGFISPGIFIPLAEEVGYIEDIGLWVLRAACAQIQAWQQAGWTPPTVAVNVSGRQIMRGDFPEKLGHLLAEFPVRPQQLEIEITETSLMQQSELPTNMLRRLRDMGVQLAMDDFGTGYSSMSYMKRFRLNTLKIDKSFIEDLPNDESDCGITRAIIALAHNLGMRVVAEGVETVAQRDFLRAEGCDSLQGYRVSRPVPPKEFERFLST